MFPRARRPARAPGAARRALFGRLVAAAAAALALAAAGPARAQPLCTRDQNFALSVAFSTNRTGHPQLKALLEQPVTSAAWLLDVELSTASCGPGRTTRVLGVALNGAALRFVPPGYISLPGLGHFRRPERALPWEAARDLCASEGAVLAVPASKHEMDALLSVFTLNVTDTKDSSHLWLGATDLAKEGTYVTVTGVPLRDATSLTWGSGQPDGKASQNCLAYDKSSSLRDIECTYVLAFVCKVDFNYP